MYSFLPDELLKEILTPALQVPDESFACTTGRSPFSNYERSTSAYLLVCKDWLRVATPLLYSVVVLRSKAQMQALEYALQSTPLLGAFIKKLRIESGYCTSLSTILKSTKNLTDLCLSLEIYSHENVTALRKGFSSLRLQRLIVYDPDRTNNQKGHSLVDAICQYIPEWPLTEFVFPAISWRSSSRNHTTDLVYALCQSKSIQVIHLTPRHLYMDPTWMPQLVKIPSITKVVVAMNEGLLQRTRDAWKDYPVVEFVDVRNFAPKEQSKAVCLGQASTRDWLKILPKNAWQTIILHAMGISDLEDTEFDERLIKWQDCFGCSYRRGLALVCKLFYELSIPLYYRSIVTASDRELATISVLFSRRPELGHHARSLFTIERSYMIWNAEHLSGILAHTPNLRRVAALSRYSSSADPKDIFDWQALTTLSQVAGPRLVDLSTHVTRPNNPKPAEPLLSFTSLKNLKWTSSAKLIFDAVTIPKDGLPNLESLTCVATNNSLLSFLSLMDLPRIRIARFPMLEKCEGVVPFLRKHGPKLKILQTGFIPGINIFDICVNLEKFEVPAEKAGFAISEFFSSYNPHPLQEIHIMTKDVRIGVERDRFKYLEGLDLSSFPSLRQVKVDRCPWPETEHEIKRSHWVMWAERLQQLYNVHIVDASGQKWTPRLRARSEK